MLRMHLVLRALVFFFQEDDFVNEKEYYHGNAAIEDGSADVIEPRSHKMTGHGGPDAVDGIDHTCDHAEGQQIPHSLAEDVALGAEHPASLDEEVDHFADEHGDHIGGEIDRNCRYRQRYGQEHR